MGQFYCSRIDQLEHDWELRSRDIRVRIEHTRLLEHPETAIINLQAFLTITGGERRFQYLHIEDRSGLRLFSFGKDLKLASIPLPPGVSSGYYFDPSNKELYRVFLEQIWLGEHGMGRIAIFYRIDNALLQRLATPGVTLTALHNHQAIASSLGERGIEDESLYSSSDHNVEHRSIPWNADESAPLTITISAPVKALFSITELAIAACVIPIIDALILWFVLGTWLMRQAKRINRLGDAVREFATEH